MRQRYFACLACVLAGVLGCGASGPEFALVEGIVLIGGRPAEGILVEFHPDPDAKTFGPSSHAITDSEGKFVLQCADVRTGKVRQGAVVGSHRVTLADPGANLDPTASNYRPSRVPDEHGRANLTPLVHVVTSGANKASFELPSAPKR